MSSKLSQEDGNRGLQSFMDEKDKNTKSFSDDANRNSFLFANEGSRGSNLFNNDSDRGSKLLQDKSQSFVVRGSKLRYSFLDGKSQSLVNDQKSTSGRRFSRGVATQGTVLPWTPSCKKQSRYQIKAAFKDNLLDHMNTLDPDNEVSPYPLTKVVCCIGPDTSSVQFIEKLLDAGMTTVSLSMWLFTNEQKIMAIENIKQALKNVLRKDGVVYPLGIGIDLRGPQVFTGRLSTSPVLVTEGGTFKLTVNKIWRNCGTARKVFLNCPQHPGLINQITPGVIIMIDAGRIVLEVKDVIDEDVVCNATKGGKLYNERIVHFMGMSLFIKDLTDEDMEDIEFAINMQLDFLFISSVRSEKIIKEIRRLIEFRQVDLLLIAKIENKVAIHSVEPIVTEADAIAIVRNYLAVELAEERILLMQDKFIAICKMFGKPIFVEGLLLRTCSTGNDVDYEKRIDSMQLITCCQKGIDGMLMRDSLVFGFDPTILLQISLRIFSVSEPSYWHSHFFSKMSRAIAPPMNPMHALAIAAVHTAMIAGAVAILVCSTSGSSAKLVCRYSPRVPVIVITRCAAVARQLTLFKASIPYLYTEPLISNFRKEIDVRFHAGINLGKEIGIIKPGDPIVLLNGYRPGPGSTNTMRMVYASNEDTFTSGPNWKVQPHSNPVPVEKPQDIHLQSEERLYSRRSSITF